MNLAIHRDQSWAWDFTLNGNFTKYGCVLRFRSLKYFNSAFEQHYFKSLPKHFKIYFIRYLNINRQTKIFVTSIYILWLKIFRRYAIVIDIIEIFSIFT